LRATAGAEFEKLTAQSSESFSAAAFTIESRSDRMGYRLSGPGLHTNEPVELLSAAVSFGTVQVLPNGQLTVLMADHQTTGGYPRIAQVIESDLPLLAQLSAGCRVAFYLISQVDAEQIALAQSADLAKLAAAAKMMWQ
jgi:antagonist of KipI